MAMHQRHSAVGVWLSIVIGCVFALLALFVVLFGADIYTSVLNDGSQNDITRTAVLYIANKVRQHDSSGGVSLQDIEGNPALVLSRTVDDANVLTYLYLYRDELCEVSVLEGMPVCESAGQPVFPLSAVTFFMPATDLLSVSLSDGNGHSASLTLYLRTAEVTP